MLRLLASGILLGLVLREVPIAQIADSIRSFDLVWIAPILALHLLGVLIRSAKLRFLSGASGVPIDFRSAVRIYFLGNLAYAIVPSLDIAQVGLLGYEKGRYARAALSVSMDRLSGMVALFAIGAAALMLRPSLFESLHKATPALIGSLLFIALAVLCAGFSDRVHRALWRKTPARLREGTDPIARGVQSLHVGLTLLGERKARIVLLLGLALLFQLSGLGSYYLMCRALEIPVSPAGLAAVFPLMGLANLFPSILGIGARDAGFVLALQQVQIQPADAVTLSALHLALILYSAAIGAALLFFRRARLHPEMDSE